MSVCVSFEFSQNRCIRLILNTFLLISEQMFLPMDLFLSKAPCWLRPNYRLCRTSIEYRRMLPSILHHSPSGPNVCNILQYLPTRDSHGFRNSPETCSLAFKHQGEGVPPPCTAVPSGPSRCGGGGTVQMLGRIFPNHLWIIQSYSTTFNPRSDGMGWHDGGIAWWIVTRRAAEFAFRFLPLFPLSFFLPVFIFLSLSLSLSISLSLSLSLCLFIPLSLPLSVSLSLSLSISLSLSLCVCVC